MQAATTRSVRVRLEDRPGSLAAVTALLAANDINVTRLEVVSRDGEYAWDDFQIEADSDRVVGSVVRTLRVAGYEVVGLPLHWQVKDWALDVIATMGAMLELATPTAVEHRFLQGLGSVARATHTVLLADDFAADARAAVGRWEALDALARSLDHRLVAWVGDHDAITALRAALDSTGHDPPPRSPRNRIGGAAFLLGSTPRRGLVAAVGGRPPFLRAETERLRTYVEIVAQILMVGEAVRP